MFAQGVGGGLHYEQGELPAKGPSRCVLPLCDSEDKTDIDMLCCTCSFDIECVREQRIPSSYHFLAAQIR